ncbi:hypothetical protein AGDE_14742 [Angomonas deanei]|nr:hypothetical protein AGDE_14742 [Angomonas deanei]|eukprot:EPY20313.1 hypothetical protein AGDE_14742 [Angomonas deanei]
MRYGGPPRGRGGYRGGGYQGEYRPRHLSDTLAIHVSNVRRPVTEEMMRQVFGSVRVQPVSVMVCPTGAGGDCSVTAQFQSPKDAEAVHNQLNDRNIYNDGNKMTISYAQPPSGVLESFPPYSAPPAPQMYPPPPMAGGYMGNMSMPPYAGFNPMMDNNNMRGRGRGRGRGMPMPMGGYPYNNGPMPMNPMQSGMPMNHVPGPTVYLSVTVVPESEPLQTIFVLMEVFGGVVTIRRTQRNKEILTVKCADIEDAENIARHLRRVPYAGGTVSGKPFPTYVDRHPCTDEGDPNDPATEQYNFTASRHRRPGQRSKCGASRYLKVTGCSSFTVEDIQNYLTSKNFTPESITKDEEGDFLVVLPSIEAAVNVIITCQANICGEERSSVLFVPEPVQPQAAQSTVE